MDVTKDFQTFVDSIFDMDYHEIYEFVSSSKWERREYFLV